MTSKMYKRSWVEIDLEALEDNYKIYRNLIPATTQIMAVVKADAYGCGYEQVAKTMQECGCKNFAVSNIYEAIELRQKGINGQILILGYTSVDAADELIKYDLTQTILDEEYANDLIATNKKIKCQYAIDTGMNRIGIDGENLKEAEKEIRRINKVLDLKGIFTHLCVADANDENSNLFTKKQLNIFNKVADSVSDLKLEYIHSLNSAGSLFHYDENSNLARLGIVLYGLKPDYNDTLPEGVKPVISWKSVVSMIKEVKAGETIGYGRTYTAKQNMKVATIPTGYADGYSRYLSNIGHVYINGQKSNIVGKVCMDQMMVDVTNLKVGRNDEVVLLDQTYTADDMAKTINTIGYEIICNISKRVPRIYK